MRNLLKIYLVSLILASTFFPSDGSHAQAVSGRISSFVYSWNVQDQQSGPSGHLRWYQTLVLNAKGIGSQNVSLHTNFRYTKDFNNDNNYNYNWKVQYIYAKVKNIFKTTNIKIGRHYIYAGVGNGSIDGVSGKIKLKNIGDIELYGGMPVSWYREFKIQKWNEGRMYGFRLQPRTFLKTLVGISYVQKHQKPIPYEIPGKFTFQQWDIASDAMELAGLDFYTEWSKNTTLYGRFDWDVMYDDIYRGNFYYKRVLNEKFSVSAEYYYRRPRIYKNSIFSVFTQYDNKEYWLRFYYKIKKNVSLSCGTSVVSYSNEKGYRYNINLNTKYYNVGYSHTSGYAGRLDGITGSINYPVRNNILVRGGSNISRYKLFEHLEDFQNLFSTFAGITILPKKTCSLDIEGQGLHNYNYSGDFRLLMRANYWFSFHKSKGK